MKLPFCPSKSSTPRRRSPNRPTPIRTSKTDTTITIIKSLITFMTKTLFDLFPMQRSKIQTILENTSKSVFNVVTKVSHSGHKIHLTFDQ
jgi:hypothetical protein